jgi:hypothetical protein
MLFMKQQMVDAAGKRVNAGLVVAGLQTGQQNASRVCAAGKLRRKENYSLGA